MEKNQATFGKPKYGLHGKALPNFFHKSNSAARLKPASTEDGLAIDCKPQTTVDWWKNDGSYKQTPTHVSHRELRHRQKIFSKPEPLYLNEMQAGEPPVDHFKRDRSLKIKRHDDDSAMKWDKPNSYPLPDDLDALTGSANKEKPPRRTHKTTRFSDIYSKPSVKAFEAA